jgi:hypothetical protein
VPDPRPPSNGRAEEKEDWQMPDRNFGTGVGDKIEKLYSDVVKPQHGANSQGGCMAAVYDGALSALYGEIYAKELWRTVYRTAKKLDSAKGRPEGSSNSVDLIMETLQKHGRAGDPWEFRFKAKKWSCESPKEFLGKGVEEAIGQRLNGDPEGWYFYGASVSGGYHSVVLGAHKQGAVRKIYWLDQFSKGLKNRRSGYATPSTDVTGRLDNSLIKVGTNRTKLWPLYVKP